MFPQLRLFLLLVGCPRAALPPVVEPASPVSYARALDDAAYPLPSEVVDDLLTLTPDSDGVVFDDQGRVLMTTWSRSRYYGDEYVPGYRFSLYGETWFTAGTQVADACAGLTGDALALRVEQLLGLPPGGGRDVFVQVWIDPAALKRPCADPDVTARSCPIATPLKAGDGDRVSWDCSDVTGHAQWLCNTWVNRYGASDETMRFPWTALGYTYDWGNPDDPEGATEFVAPGGTEVTLSAIIKNDDFCSAP